MNKYSRLTFLLYLLASCYEREPSTIVIDKIQFNDNAIGTFHYNIDGKISKYEYSNNGKIEYYTDYRYSNGLLVNKVHYLKSKSGYTSIDYTYVYNNNNIVEVRNSSTSLKYLYEWKSGRIFKVSHCENKDICLRYEILKYDGKGNIREVNRYSIENGNERLNYIIEYTYNDNFNPFQNLASPENLFFGSLNYYEASVNNISIITERLYFHSLPYKIFTYSNTFYDTGYPNVVNKFSSEILIEKRKYYYKEINK